MSWTKFNQTGRVLKFVSYDFSWFISSIRLKREEEKEEELNVWSPSLRLLSILHCSIYSLTPSAKLLVVYPWPPWGKLMEAWMFICAQHTLQLLLNIHSLLTQDKVLGLQPSTFCNIQLFPKYQLKSQLICPPDKLYCSCFFGCFQFVSTSVLEVKYIFILPKFNNPTYIQKCKYKVAVPSRKTFHCIVPASTFIVKTPPMLHAPCTISYVFVMLCQTTNSHIHIVF